MVDFFLWVVTGRCLELGRAGIVQGGCGISHSLDFSLSQGDKSHRVYRRHPRREERLLAISFKVAALWFLCSWDLPSFWISVVLAMSPKHPNTWFYPAWWFSPIVSCMYNSSPDPQETSSEARTVSPSHLHPRVASHSARPLEAQKDVCQSVHRTQWVNG